MKNRKFLAFLVSCTLFAVYSTPVCAQTVSADAKGTSFSSSTDAENAVLVDGKTVTLDSVTVDKTGDSSGDEADFYGENAAVLATNGAALTIKNATVTTNGAHANGVFSYGDGTTVNISDSTIKTSSNNSGGIMTTGGATMNADHLTITTSGGSSAAIRSDRGGGDVNVNGGTYTTSGSGSPAIYSTADITVQDATLKSTASEAVVVEGGNSVSLTDVDATGNNTRNSQSEEYKNVLIYQSMSGDATDGSSSFEMTGGSMTANNGHMFFVTNTTCTINLENVAFTYADGDFLRAAADAWGNSGSNGGNVTLNAANQDIEGAINVDSVSSLNLYLTEQSAYEGSINTTGEAGGVYVSVDDDSVWTLTADTYITSLSCDDDAIDLAGHTLYVDGTEYAEGTASKGTEVEGTADSSAQNNTYTGTITSISKDSVTLEVQGQGGAPAMSSMGASGAGKDTSSSGASNTAPEDRPGGNMPQGGAPGGNQQGMPGNAGNNGNSGSSGNMGNGGGAPGGSMQGQPGNGAKDSVPENTGAGTGASIPDMPGNGGSMQMPSMSAQEMTFSTAEDFTDEFKTGDVVTITIEEESVVSMEAADVSKNADAGSSKKAASTSISAETPKTDSAASAEEDGFFTKILHFFENLFA